MYENVLFLIFFLSMAGKKLDFKIQLKYFNIIANILQM